MTGDPFAATASLTSATSGSSPRSKRRSPSSTSTRCGRTPLDARAGGAEADPGGDEVDPLPAPDGARSLRRDPGFAGLMTYTLPETVWLAEQGFEDLLLAYPSVDVEGPGRAGAALGRRPRRGADRDGRLRRAPRRDRVGARAPARRRSASASTSTPAGGRCGGRIKVGPKRSPVRTRRAGGGAGAGDRARGRSSSSTALMAYEAQIAGVTNRRHGPAARSSARCSDASATELAERRGAARSRPSREVGLQATNS